MTDQWEKDYLERGTAVGPVTQEMIDRCKAKGPPNYEYWPDFLPVVRAEMAEEGKPVYWTKTNKRP